MKRILPLLSAVLLLAAHPLCEAAPPACTTEVPGAGPTAALSDEEWTERCFYRFIRYDVIDPAHPAPADKLRYTGFPNAVRAYGALLGFIAPASARVDFDACGRYESDLLRVVYTERNVKGGFARLTVTFKKRESPNRYTVVFRKK